MKHMWYIALTGLLSYNLAEIFKIKHESGFLIRAGLMSLMSFTMVPVDIYLAEDMNLSLYVVTWSVCFCTGLFFATYGARMLQAKFSLFFSRFTVKNKIRKGSKTDIRYMDKELPNLPDYNPHKFINLKKGIFIRIDEMVKPIYLLLDDWYKRHFLIVGATHAGKGVAMQSLGVQSLILGETVVFLDPKCDQYMPHILKAQCEKQGVPYHYIDLAKDEQQINLIADFSNRDLKNCLVEAFSQREMGSESDVYRKNEQEFLENLADFIVEQNLENISNIKAPSFINSTQKIEPELNANAQIKPKSLSDFITRKDWQQQTSQVNNQTNTTNHGEHHAINQPNTTSDNSSNRANQEQKTSTSKSDYLF